MNDRRNATILLFILVLIPVLLTDPLEWPKRVAKIFAPQPASKQNAPAKIKTAPGFQSWNDPSFDREAFLASFRRQSAMGLRECLIGAGLQERALSAYATLNRRGELSQLHWNNEEPLPTCVIQTIHAMNFVEQSEHLKRPSIELQWRVDW